VELEMKNKMNVLRAAVIAGSVLAAGSVMAADGSIGTSSEGSITLTATIPTLFKVLIEDDSLDFGTITDTSSATLTETTGFCVQSTGGPNFKLSLSAVTNAPTDTTAFALVGSAPTNTIAFSADYTPSGGGTAVDLEPGVAEDLTTAEDFTGCTNSNESGNISYVIDETSLLAAPAGSYSATSYVTVAAQ
jgi:hypothetical protein